ELEAVGKLLEALDDDVPAAVMALGIGVTKDFELRLELLCRRRLHFGLVALELMAVEHRCMALDVGPRAGVPDFGRLELRIRDEKLVATRVKLRATALLMDCREELLPHEDEVLSFEAEDLGARDEHLDRRAQKH